MQKSLCKIIILLFMGIMAISAEEVAPKQLVSINVSNGSVYNVLKEIEKQTGYMFFYKTEDLGANKSISIHANKKALGAVLDELASKMNLSYSFKEKHILLQQRGSSSVKNVTISGRVVDKDNQPIIGANVFVKGTTVGVVTDVDGNFSLVVPSEQSVLVFSYIGYTNQEAQVGTHRHFTITLAEATQQLDELVVTALGMKRSEKALGYATQKVGGEQFEKVKGVNVATSLTGRISGLTVFNSTEFMESPTLSLRGETPLLVLDGVPTNLTLADINSDDIETIDVLKGATASALYGSRGGSGAVMITTKKGGKEGFTVTVNSSNMINAGTLALPKVQHSYSSGYGGKYNTDDEVWGDKLDIGRIYSQYDPYTHTMVDKELTSAGKDNFKNFTEFSMISNTNVSVTQSGKNGSVRSSASFIYDKGQYPNEKGKEFRYSIGGTMKLGDKVNIEGTLGFNKQVAPNTAGTGYGAQGYIYNMLVWTGPEYDVTQYKDYWVIPNEKQNWMRDSWYDNPYLSAYEKINRVDNTKTNGMLTINYQITPWLKALIRGGYDYTNNATKRRAPLDIHSQRNWGSTDKGYYSEKSEDIFTTNNDFILTGNGKIGKFSIDGLVGASLYYYRDKYLKATTKNGLSVPGFYSLKASVASPTVDSYVANKQVNSLFGKATFGYDNTFYLDVTGRNDWSSTLPDGDNSYFYPSVGLSAIMSQVIKLPDWFTFWKLRGSWTVSKNDLSIYATNQAYSITNAVWDGLNTAAYPTTMRGHVKPITNRTYEIGTSMYFLKNNRIKADLTYYNKLTYNNTVQTTISSMSGFENVLINNDEEYVRRGFELVLEATPIITKDFKWTAVTNWSTSRRYFAKIDPKYSADKLWVYKGARVDYCEDNDFQYDPNGNIIMTNGYPKLFDYTSKIGYYDPNWVWGLTNTFKYKKFTFSVSVDGRIGGLSYASTNANMWKTGAHPDTDNQWRYDEVVNGKKNYVADGVYVVSGSATYDSYGRITSDNRVFAKNETPVSYETYIKSYFRKGADVNYLSETFIKLRELSLTYDIPNSLSKKIGISNSSIALVGQNLLLWTKEYKFADPDKASDDLNSPSVRYIGVNFKLEF